MCGQYGLMGSIGRPVVDASGPQGCWPLQALWQRHDPSARNSEKSHEHEPRIFMGDDSKEGAYMDKRSDRISRQVMETGEQYLLWWLSQHYSNHA